MNLLEFEESLRFLKKSDEFAIRDYQLKAARNIADKGNSLLIMPTALGKTFVAVLVIAHFLQKNAGKTDGTKVLFLTPTKPLAMQQADRLRKFLNVDPDSIKVVSGDTGPDERAEVWKTGRLFSATPQTLANDLVTGRASITDFGLIFFDEVHKAVGDYDYVFIANALKGRNDGALVVGMTASPSSDMEKVGEICENLHVKNVEIFDEKDAEAYTKEIKLQFNFVKMSQELNELRKHLQTILTEVALELKPFGLMSSKPSKKEMLELRGILLKLMKEDKNAFKGISLQAKAMNLMHAIDLLECQGIEVFLDFLQEMEGRKLQSKAVASLLADPRITKVKAVAQQFLDNGIEHPKIAELKRILKREFAENQGSSAIVFVNFRNSIRKLVKELNGAVGNGFVARQFIGKTKGMSKKEQVKTLDDFRAGEFNIMVSSSIGEEGLDIPTVDTVVFYEAVPSEIRAIQRRGRTGRIRNGKAIMLITQGTKDEAYYWISMRKERLMKENLRALRNDLDDKNSQTLATIVKTAEVSIKPAEVAGNKNGLNPADETVSLSENTEQKSLDDYC